MSDRLEKKIDSVAAALMVLLRYLQGTHDDEISQILESLLNDMDDLSVSHKG